ncbi:MAG: histidine kinase [Prolixibacteraceae bacterium]|nr:histidine kinase [Prolixibacteraceae bacterium]
MKNLLFSILALLSVLISVAQKPIIIKGKIDNCSNREISYIEKRWFSTKSLREESKRFDFSIAEDGTFRLKITEPDNYYARYWIHMGNEYTHLDLISGDSINMTLNGIWYDESIKYTGFGAGRNNYRRDVFLEFWDRDATSKIYNEPDLAYFLSGLNTLTDRKLELLNKYLQTGDIDSSYYKFEKASIFNERASQVLTHNSRYRNHKNASGNVATQLTSILNAVDFSDDHLMQHSSFRELVTKLPRYIVDRNSGTTDGDLKGEIAYANAHYTKEMNLFFDLEVIRNYLNKAHSLSEKRALLSFFSDQFSEPELKKEIQRQRGYISRNQGINSGMFQGILAAIAFFIGLIAALFVVVKLIKITSIKRINIDIALWLKVGFYLFISFVALAYIMNNPLRQKALVGVVLWLGFFLAHTYRLIPKYALARNYLRYLQILGVAFIVSIAGLYLCERNMNAARLVLAGSCIFGAIVLLSWASYYTNLLASHKSTLKDLVKSGDLNLELAFNLVIFFLINFVFVAGVGNNQILSIALPFYAVMLLFYFHAFISYPLFFSKEKAIQFAGINLAILLVASIGMIVFDGFQSYKALKLLGINKSMFELFSIKNLRFDFLLLFASVLIPSFVYYSIKERFKNLDTTGFSLYRKKEAELAQLRSQVNPHFLFNTLNTLYAFALKEGSEKTAECIAKLANLMRFMLDDMEKESILLQREVSYIEDYVKLQSIRSAVDHDISVTVDIDEEQGYSIAPMLLIPFVENAFKHGMNPNEVSHLKIDITGKDDKIQFVIENSVDENFEAYYKEKGFGIGIENVKSRLKHIYPDQHNISIAKTIDKFIVILTIDIL